MDACGEVSSQSFQQRYHAEEVEERFGRFKPGVIRYTLDTMGCHFYFLSVWNIPILLGITRMEACYNMYNMSDRKHPFILSHLSKVCRVLGLYHTSCYVIWDRNALARHGGSSHACDPRA